MDQTTSVTDPLLLLQLENADLLAEAHLATMSTAERYAVAKHLLVTAGSVYRALPPLPRDLVDQLSHCIDAVVAYVANPEVYAYLYDEEDRWVHLLEGDIPDDEWRMA